jgi:dienelactone hydrolase
VERVAEETKMRGIARIGRRATFALLASVAALSAAGAARTAELGFVERAVQLPGTDVVLSGVEFVPAATRLESERRAAIVLLHGCGGMGDSRGALTLRHRDWAERFARWGLVVLVLDSFAPRGLRSICELERRPIQPWRERTADAYAALDHLVARNDVDPDAVLVLGWSHGASTVMGVVRPQAPGRRAEGPRFKAAVAFYPGCAAPLAQPHYRATMPLLILHGAADDWTPAAPCLELARRSADAAYPPRTVVYPDAHHGFDGLAAPVRRLPNVYNPGAPGNRGAHVGTHEAARRLAIEEVRLFVQARLGRRLPADGD